MNRHLLTKDLAQSEALRPVPAYERRYSYTMMADLERAVRALDVALIRASAVPNFPDPLHQSRLDKAEDALEAAIAQAKELLP